MFNYSTSHSNCHLENNQSVSMRLYLEKLLFSSFFRQFITHIHQKLNLLILHSPIQCHTEPMGLVHVPAGEDARFLTERTNQSGIAFEIHYTDFIIAGHSQILSGDVHDHGKPFLVPTVPEHQKAGILGEEMLTLCVVVFRYVSFQLASVHDAFIPKSRLPSAHPEQKPSFYPQGTLSHDVPSYARG